MARPPDERRRRKLLDQLIEAFAHGGIGGRSLREVAEAVGTSQRMLLHHFGSRDELLLAIVEEVERRQATTLADLPDEPADVAANRAPFALRPLTPIGVPMPLGPSQPVAARHSTVPHEPLVPLVTSLKAAACAYGYDAASPAVPAIASIAAIIGVPADVPP